MKAKNSPWDVVGRQGLTMRCRFEDKFEKRGSDECWEWKAGKTKRGYGQFKANDEYHGKSFKWGTKPMSKAHRLAAELAHGQCPEGMVVMHSCDNPSCVNPAHLSYGTQRDNVIDMTSKGRHGSQKLSEDDYTNIKRLRESGVSVTDISTRFECSESHIYHIIGDMHEHSI